MKKYISIPLFILGVLVILISVLELYSTFIEMKSWEYYLSDTADTLSFCIYSLALASPAIYLLWISLFSKDNLNFFRRKSLYAITSIMLLSFSFETVMNNIAPSDGFLAKDAMSLYHRGEYKAALIAFEKLDEKNIMALAMMGKMYGNGYGVEVDYEKAIQLLQLPVKKNSPWSKSELVTFTKALEQTQAR